MDGEISLLLNLIDQAFDKKAWHGTNLKGSLRRMTASEAAWRPAAGRHNAWEIAVHCAYWKYAVWRRLKAVKRGSFPLKGSNWFLRPGGDADWKADLALLSAMHAQLREAIAGLKTVTKPAMLNGIAAHDLYHAGQIQLLRRLRQGAQGGV
ncbi:MAG TPA: DinB family protein [Bryobacteraceae bacterium]|nr:DinB family protein [Bryobacteraceae bacterium]